MVLFGRLLTGKGHKGISWGARNVLYLDLGSSYIAVVISYYCCKKSYHRFDGLKYHLFFYSSGAQKSKIRFPGPKPKYQQGYAWTVTATLQPWGTMRENPCPCLFQFLELHSSIFPSSIFQACSIASGCNPHTAFCLSSQISLCFPLIKRLVITFRALSDDPK